MGAFGIFAFVVTFAYVVYYVVVYNMDTHKKTDSKSDTEVIDVPGSVTSIPDDPPTLVVETSNGKYTIPGNDNEADDEMADEDGENQESPVSDSADAVMERLLNEMEPVNVSSEAEFESDELKQLLLDGGLTPSRQQIVYSKISI